MNNSRPNSRVSRAQRHNKKNSYKKNNFSFLKPLSILIVLALIFYLILNFSNIFSTKAYASPLTTTTSSTSTIKKLNGSGAVYQNYSPNNLNTVSGYMKEQAHLLQNIQRFDINTVLSMNYYDIVNLYPDSINSANALQSNFSEYSNILSTSVRNSEEPIVSDIVNLNTALVDSVIKYSQLLHSGAGYTSIISERNVVQANFEDLTNIINKNISLF